MPELHFRPKESEGPPIHIFFRNRQAILFPIDVTFGDTNDTHCLLEDWAPSARYYDDGVGYFSVTFTAPPATADTVTLSILTRLVIDENGYPVGTEGGTQNYSGDGWNFDASNNTLTLTSGSYDFSGKGNALRPLNPDVRLVVESGATVVVPDPKPEPTPDPTPEAPTYTLTVKGGTFTYNGGEAMTSASVPVDAEVKVTLNQSAVPEGMVFDLWAIDEASLLGNPAVAYNEESFTIPAGSPPRKLRQLLPLPEHRRTRSLPRLTEPHKNSAAPSFPVGRRIFAVQSRRKGRVRDIFW